ncbi:hypothetical protein ACTPEM_26665, partial [Clostridioides difficile]
KFNDKSNLSIEQAKEKLDKIANDIGLDTINTAVNENYINALKSSCDISLVFLIYDSDIIA